MKRAFWLGLGAALIGAVPAFAEEGEASGPLVVNGGLMIWTLVIFLVTLVVLTWGAFKPITRAVEAREQALEDAIEGAKRDREEAARLLEEHKKLLLDTRTQASGLLAEARAAAEKERALALQKTKQEQEDLLERARREITEERERALVELRREAVDISLAAASKLIGERLGSDADRKLVDSYLATLEPGR